jgi:hypothetical protein
VNDEVDAVAGADADFEKPGRMIGTDEHCEVIDLKDAYRMLIGVEDVFVGLAVFTVTGEDDRIHNVNVS